MRQRDEYQPQGLVEQLAVAAWMCTLLFIHALFVAVIVTGVTVYLAAIYYAMNGEWPGR